ncbi:MAG: cyclic lactone autoinducer peptide [Sphingobacteriaceae bacterium]|nr:cyclic lactone autoinducer peptide [Sphingobacteriaceae bacterium]
MDLIIHRMLFFYINCNSTSGWYYHQPKHMEIKR